VREGISNYSHSPSVVEDVEVSTTFCELGLPIQLKVKLVSISSVDALAVTDQDSYEVHLALSDQGCPRACTDGRDEPFLLVCDGGKCHSGLFQGH
jgi:hypothetical protein